MWTDFLIAWQQSTRTEFLIFDCEAKLFITCQIVICMWNDVVNNVFDILFGDCLLLVLVMLVLIAYMLLALFLFDAIQETVSSGSVSPYAAKCR